MRRLVSRPLIGAMTAGIMAGLVTLAGAQGLGPALPPGFYGELPEAYPGPKAPDGIRRLALVATSNIVGETDPCG